METSAGRELLIEGEDYYFENGLMVLTARYHLRRGYCCEQGCRNCPFVYSQKKANSDAQPTETQT